MGLGLQLERPQHLGRHFRRRDFAVARAYPDHLGARNDGEGDVSRLLPHVVPPASHEAFDGVDGARGISGELSPGRFADHHAVGRIRNDGRQKLAPLRVRDDPWDTSPVDVGDEAIGRPEINADDA